MGIARFPDEECLRFTKFWCRRPMRNILARSVLLLSQQEVTGCGANLLEMGEDETKGSETTSTEKAHEGDAASSGSRASMCIFTLLDGHARAFLH